MGAKGRPRGRQGRPRRRQGCQRAAKGRHGEAKGSQRAAKALAREAKGTPRGAKGQPRGGQGSFSAKGWPRVADGRPKAGHEVALGCQMAAQKVPCAAKGRSWVAIGLPMGCLGKLRGSQWVPQGHQGSESVKHSSFLKRPPGSRRCSLGSRGAPLDGQGAPMGAALGGQCTAGVTKGRPLEGKRRQKVPLAAPLGAKWRWRPSCRQPGG